MQIEVNDFTDVQRSETSWSQGLYIWLPERDVNFGRIPAGIFQVDFVLNPETKSLKEAVDFYVNKIRENPTEFAPGKYNVRVLVDFDQRHSVTLKIS